MSKVTDIGEKRRDKCLRCGGNHELIACPSVRAIEVYEDGTLSFVEFFEPAPPGDEPTAA